MTLPSVGIRDSFFSPSEMADLYGTPGGLDLWIGALAEGHLAGSALGELMSVAIAAEFTRLANGDAFFYRWDPDLDDEIRAEIEGSSLAKV